MRKGKSRNEGNKKQSTIYFNKPSLSVTLYFAMLKGCYNCTEIILLLFAYVFVLLFFARTFRKVN